MLVGFENIGAGLPRRLVHSGLRSPHAKSPESFTHAIAALSAGHFPIFPSGRKSSAAAAEYVLWGELNARVDAFELFERAISEGISFAPGHIFYTDGRFSNYLRISFGTPCSEVIENGLKRLGELILSMQQ